ncbi:hypothetical protein JI721_15000 [Alicyclobacillus cycloheptanicus]|uniref:Uncharacterized protein n=1 Tax=Alicyclobacillus cycloheptanicus TaxID=1457 RepID=A0ABT9XD65_9BACL|nr:hypothetical protein [Alicyclobacillus cycloheptanicus]MDQ0188241.1 hypothetical protein [Alicyclobacillus cycloheptanicus]WDM00968.1 hypothetical protein JI721_15000 [Alicyclobacillus cycloheptanicus]
MKRGIEAVLIAIVSVATLSGAMSLLRGHANENPIDRWVAQAWSQVGARTLPNLEAWTAESTKANDSNGNVDGNSSGHVVGNGAGQDGTPAKSSPANSAAVREQGEAAPTGSKTSHTSTDAAGATGSTHSGASTTAASDPAAQKVVSVDGIALSPDDVARLAEIGDQVIHALSPVEWKEIANAITTAGGSPTSDETLIQIVQRHLSAQDEAWLLGLFTQGADQKDGKANPVLQRSVTQAESELTPAERKILESEINPSD